MKWLTLVAFSVAICSVAVADTIYVVTESDGTIRFTSKPPPPGAKVQVFTSRGPTSTVPVRRRGRIDQLILNRFSDLVRAAASEYGISKALIKAVIHVESGFNPQAVSPKGAQGLMQLMPATAKFLEVKDPFSPRDNIFGGARFLSYLLQRYQGNVRLALAAYNAGEDDVERYRGVPPFPETQAYVSKVMALERRYAVALRQ